MYYFDYSATTPLHTEVLDLINNLNKEVYGNPSSIYTIGKKARVIIENARLQVAESISAKPEQIIFTSGGTESNNQVLWSFVNKTNSHIISSVIEHPAITKVLKTMENFGVKHELVNVDKDGIILINELINKIKSNTRLISIMMANNEIGVIQPLKKIIDIAHDKNILVHTDAVQCLGKIKLDVSRLKVDFLSLSAHKFYGPKGIGAIYIKDPDNIDPFIIGGGQEKGLRAGTEDVSSIAGMGLAAKLASHLIGKKIKLLEKFENKFKKGVLKFYSKAIFNGDQKNKLPGIVNISFPNHRSEILMTKLNRVDIAVSNGSACGAGIIKPSPVLSAIGVDEKTNLSALRFSFGITNTEEQIDFLLKQLKDIVKK